MNLLDVIPVAKPKSTGVAKGKVDAYAKFRSDLQTTLDTVHPLMYENGGRYKSDMYDSGIAIAKKLVDSHNGQTLKLIEEHFATTMAIPNNLGHQSLKVDVGHEGFYLRDIPLTHSDLGRLNASPRSKLSDLMEISKIANMVVIPFDYLNPQSYAAERNSTRSAISAFNTSSKRVKMDNYVICPLRHYSILHHLKAENPNGQIVGNSYAQNFDVLAMMMPAMIMFSDRLTNVEGGLQSLYAQVNSLDASMKGVVRGMESMEKQLSQLQEKVEKQQLEMLRQTQEAEQLKLAQARMEVELQELRTAQRQAYSWFMAYEPLMFAVPHGTDLMCDKAQAIVGPCWGPDFDEIVAAALQLKMKRGQREKLNNIIHEIW